MDILPLDRTNRQHILEAAELLREAFACYAEDPMAEMEACLEVERIALAAVEDGHLVGFVGAIPQYGTTGWELHPLVVRKDKRGHGVGAALMLALETACRARGGVMIYLGSDDEDGATSLSGTDLYVDTFKKIEGIQNLRHHPFAFYQKQGYKIVGVFPDANGIGKPDIWMAKRLVRETFMETERLSFLHWTAGDEALAESLWGEAAVTEYISKSGRFSEQEIQDRLAFEIETEKKRGIQYWPVFEKATGALVGCCGLHPSSAPNELELGFHLKSAFWGKGYATEAARAVIAYAGANLPDINLFAGHHPENTRSKKVIEKLGFQYVGDEYYKPTGLCHPVYEYRHGQG